MLVLVLVLVLVGWLVVVVAVAVAFAVAGNHGVGSDGETSLLLMESCLAVVDFQLAPCWTEGT